MKVEEVLKIIEAEGRTIPCDMYRDHKYCLKVKKNIETF